MIHQQKILQGKAASHKIRLGQEIEPNYTSVNTNAPVDNISYTFKIPPNTADYTLNISSIIPNSKDYHRYVSNIDYRIDTSGIYNITTTQTVIVTGLTPQTRTFEPGFYDVKYINGTALFNDWVTINESGPNAFKAIPKVTGGAPTEIDLTDAPQIQSILSWPPIINDPANFIPSASVDITQSLDFMLIYLSFCRQSTENNFTNAAAIPISGTIGSTVNGTINQLTPLLSGMDSIIGPTIKIRDINNNPYLINTPILINVKILFSVRNKEVERDSYY